MKKSEIIKEYNIQKQKTEEARIALQESIENISFTGGEQESSIPPETKNKCIGVFYWTFVSYDEWRYEDDITIFKYCPKFSLYKECKNSKCPGYENYLKYRQAKNNYDVAERELSLYPLWVKIYARFQKNK